MTDLTAEEEHYDRVRAEIDALGNIDPRPLLVMQRLASLEQWARDCRDQVLYPAAQRDDAIGKAADGLGQALVEFRLGPNP